MAPGKQPEKQTYAETESYRSAGTPGFHVECPGLIMNDAKDILG